MAKAPFARSLPAPLAPRRCCVLRHDHRRLGSEAVKNHPQSLPDAFAAAAVGGRGFAYTSLRAAPDAWRNISPWWPLEL